MTLLPRCSHHHTHPQDDSIVYAMFYTVCFGSARAPSVPAGMHPTIPHGHHGQQLAWIMQEL